MGRAWTLHVVVALIVSVQPSAAAGGDSAALVLKNDHVLRELRRVDGCWRTVRFARADGSDALVTRSDEFHILPLDSERGWTVADYVAAAPPIRNVQDGVTTVRIMYEQRKPLPRPAPQKVIVIYTLGRGPYHHKTIRS